MSEDKVQAPTQETVEAKQPVVTKPKIKQISFWDMFPGEDELVAGFKGGWCPLYPETTNPLWVTCRHYVLGEERLVFNFSSVDVSNNRRITDERRIYISENAHTITRDENKIWQWVRNHAENTLHRMYSSIPFIDFDGTLIRGSIWATFFSYCQYNPTDNNVGNYMNRLYAAWLPLGTEPAKIEHFVLPQHILKIDKKSVDEGIGWKWHKVCDTPLPQVTSQMQREEEDAILRRNALRQAAEGK